ncbi:MAG: hypothetical protein AB7U85_07485 [Alphaproteobacteria bacterium]
MEYIWIGCGFGHEPDENFRLLLDNGVCWQLKDRTDNTMFRYLEKKECFKANIKDFKTKNENIFYNNTCIDEILIGCKYVFFTIKPELATKKTLANAIAIEKHINNKKLPIKIINSPSSFSYLCHKDEFYQVMPQDDVPKYHIINKISDIDNIKFSYPFILKANNFSSGKGTSLVSSRKQAIKFFIKMKFVKCFGGYISFFRNLIRAKFSYRVKLANFIPDKIIAVEYFNTKQTENFYMTGRVFFLGNNLYYAYPHISADDWCVHTDQAKNYLPKNIYKLACERINKAVVANKDKFLKAQKRLNISTLAFDFLITKENRIKILEPELKYGLDKNFLKGQEEVYALDQKHIDWIQESIKAKPIVSFDSLFLQ